MQMMKTTTRMKKRRSRRTRERTSPQSWRMMGALEVVQARVVPHLTMKAMRPKSKQETLRANGGKQRCDRSSIRFLAASSPA